MTAFEGRETPEEEAQEFDEMLTDPQNAAKIMAAAKRWWKEKRITHDQIEAVAQENNWKVGPFSLKCLCKGANMELMEGDRSPEEAINVAYNHLQDDPEYYNEKKGGW
jgi:hypothetical protein